MSCHPILTSREELGREREEESSRKPLSSERYKQFCFGTKVVKTGNKVQPTGRKVISSPLLLPPSMLASRWLRAAPERMLCPVGPQERAPCSSVPTEATQADEAFGKGL